MTWTKQHSKNAVAAKARQRLAVCGSPLSPAEGSPKYHSPHKTRVRAKWRLQIRDLEHGDSLTLLFYRLPWPARYATAYGEMSARTAGRFIQALLTHAA